MKVIRSFLLVFSILFQSLEITAQTGGVIRGQILDETTKDPLPGVNIVEYDNQNRIITGTITDINGNYVLEVRDINHNIKVSYLGYESQTFLINSRTTINIKLKEKTGLEIVISDSHL